VWGERSFQRWPVAPRGCPKDVLGMFRSSDNGAPCVGENSFDTCEGAIVLSVTKGLALFVTFPRERDFLRKLHSSFKFFFPVLVANL
jgi:hypothetical protein